MDGVHDLGEMDGTGRIEHTPEEPAFHAAWERWAFAVVMLTMANREYNMDEFRHAIERMDPGWYLASSYYDHWLAAAEKLLVEKGTLSAAALSDRIEAFADGGAGEMTVPEREDPELAATIRTIVDHGASARRGDGDPSFEVGATVRVRNAHPEGHTRCPGYVRGAEGTVEEYYGVHVLPDASAHGEGERPEPLYAVRFDGEALWGPDAEPNTSVSVDLWESYLEAPEPGPTGPREND
jgi:nitrile hydratase